MLQATAIQKIERYGQNGRKRELDQYLNTVLKEKTPTTIPFLLRTDIWEQAAAAFVTPSTTTTTTTGSATATPAFTTFVSEDFVYSMGFAVSLLGAPMTTRLFPKQHPSTSGKQQQQQTTSKAESQQQQQALLPRSEYLDQLSLHDTLSILHHLNRCVTCISKTTVNESTELTQAFAYLFGICLSWFVALRALCIAPSHLTVSGDANPCWLPDGSALNELGVECFTAVRILLINVTYKLRAQQEKYPVANLFHVRTLSIVLRNARERVHVPALEGPLVLRMAAALAPARTVPHALCFSQPATTHTTASSSSDSTSILPTSSLPFLEQDEMLKNAFARLLRPSMANRPTQLVLYYRGDEYKLSQSNISDSSQYQLYTFATTAVLDDYVRRDVRVSVTGVAEEGAKVLPAPTQWRMLSIVELWLASVPMLFRTFISESSWERLRTEQRRLKLRREALERKQDRADERKPHAAKKRSRGDGGGADGASDTHSVTHSTNSIIKPSKKTTTTASVVDEDDVLSLAGSVASTAKTAQSALLSLLDSVDMETRSVLSTMSHASAASYLSFVTAVDGAEKQKEELHTSSDGNTNLPLILLEQMLTAVQQFMDALPLPASTSLEHAEEEEVRETTPSRIVTALADAAWVQVTETFQLLRRSIRHAALQSTTKQPSKQPSGATLAAATSSSSMALLPVATTALALERHPIFTFSEDVRFNSGLGYQGLGMLFATILSPCLEYAAGRSEAQKLGHPQSNNDDEEDALGPNSIRTISGEVAQRSTWALHHSPTQQAALAQCFHVYEAVAPQVINVNLKQIVSVTALALAAEEDKKQKDDALLTTAKKRGRMQSLTTTTSTTELEEFVVQILDRFAKSSRIVVWTEALLELFFQTSEQQQQQQKNESDDKSSRRGVDLTLDAPEEAESRVRRQAIVRMLQRPSIRQAFLQAVTQTLDVEPLLEFLSTILSRLSEETLLPLREQAEEAEEEEARTPLAQRVSTAIFLLDVFRIVVSGLQPNPLTASIVCEKMAELDLLLSTFLVTRLGPSSSSLSPSGEEDDVTSTKHSLVYFLNDTEAIGWCRKRVARGTNANFLNTSAVRRKLVAAAVFDALYAVRLAMDRTLMDLGVESLDQFLQVLEAGVWEFTQHVEHLCGPVSCEQFLSWFETTATTGADGEETVDRWDTSAAVESAYVRGVTCGSLVRSNLLPSLVLQRLCMAFSVVQVLGATVSSKSKAKRMVGMVMQAWSNPTSIAAGRLRIQDIPERTWRVLARYGRRLLIEGLVPLLRAQVKDVAWQYCQSGEVLDALAVMLLEEGATGPSSPVFGSAVSALHCVVRDRHCCPRHAQVLHLLLQWLPQPQTTSQPKVAADMASLVSLLMSIRPLTTATTTSSGGSRAVSGGLSQAWLDGESTDFERQLALEAQVAWEAIPTLLWSQSFSQWLVATACTPPTTTTSVAVGTKLQSVSATILKQLFAIAIAAITASSSSSSSSSDLLLTFPERVLHIVVKKVKKQVSLDVLRVVQALLSTVRKPSALVDQFSDAILSLCQPLHTELATQLANVLRASSGNTTAPTAAMIDERSDILSVLIFSFLATPAQASDMAAQLQSLRALLESMPTQQQEQLVEQRIAGIELLMVLSLLPASASTSSSSSLDASAWLDRWQSKALAAVDDATTTASSSSSSWLVQELIPSLASITKTETRLIALLLSASSASSASEKKDDRPLPRKSLAVQLTRAALKVALRHTSRNIRNTQAASSSTSTAGGSSSATVLCACFRALNAQFRNPEIRPTSFTSILTEATTLLMSTLMLSPSASSSAAPTSSSSSSMMVLSEALTCMSTWLELVPQYTLQPLFREERFAEACLAVLQQFMCWVTHRVFPSLRQVLSATTTTGLVVSPTSSLFSTARRVQSLTASVIVQLFETLPTLIVHQRLLEDRAHVVAPFFAAAGRMVFDGLDSTGAVSASSSHNSGAATKAVLLGSTEASALVSCLFQIARCLGTAAKPTIHALQHQKKRDDDKQQGGHHIMHANVFGASLREREASLNAAALTSALFSDAAAGAHSYVFTKQADVLDPLAADLLKVLRRERVAAATMAEAIAAEGGKEEARPITSTMMMRAKSTFRDLSFVAIGSIEGHELLRQAVLREADSEDQSVLFSTKERFDGA